MRSQAEHKGRPTITGAEEEGHESKIGGNRKLQFGKNVWKGPE